MNEPHPAAKRKREPIPADVRLRLMQAVVEHRGQRGGRSRGRDYDLLRDNPEFSPYIGTHLGETGRKRLTRLVAEVTSAVPRVRGSRRASETATVETPDAQGMADDGEAVPDTSIDLLTGVGPIVVLHDQLQNMLKERLSELKKAIAAVCAPCGTPLNPGLYVKLLREHRAQVESIARLSERYQAQLLSAQFNIGIFEILKRACAGDPERYAVAAREIQELITQSGGLSQTNGDPK